MTERTLAVRVGRFVGYSELITGAAVIFLLFVWESSGLPQYILPRPSAIAAKFVSDMTSGLIWPHLWITFSEVITGFIAAAVAGPVLGSLIALFPVFERVVYPFVLAIQTVPKVAIAPLFVIWFSFGLSSKVVTAGLIAFFPILVNVVAGLRTVEPRRLLLMRALKAGAWETFLKIRFPSMLPYYFAGLEIGIIFSVIGAIVAEFVGSSAGLGSLIIQRQSAIDVPGVFSVLIYLSLMGVILNIALRILTRRFSFWSSRDDLRTDQ